MITQFSSNIKVSEETSYRCSGSTHLCFSALVIFFKTFVVVALVFFSLTGNEHSKNVSIGLSLESLHSFTLLSTCSYCNASYTSSLSEIQGKKCVNTYRIFHLQATERRSSCYFSDFCC